MCWIIFIVMGNNLGKIALFLDLMSALLWGIFRKDCPFLMTCLFDYIFILLSVIGTFLRKCAYVIISNAEIFPIGAHQQIKHFDIDFGVHVFMLCSLMFCDVSP